MTALCGHLHFESTEVGPGRSHHPGVACNARDHREILPFSDLAAGAGFRTEPEGDLPLFPT